MKNTFFIITFFILFIISFSPVFASQWVLIEDMAVGKVMLDTESIKEERFSITSANVKVISQMRVPAGSKEVKAVVTSYEFDCRKNKFRTVDPIYYFSDGSEDKLKETSLWQDSKDNLTQSLKNYLCK